LKSYLTRLEEAEKRDHRKVGKSLDLFHMQEESPGMVFWHEHGWRLYSTITQYMSELWRRTATANSHAATHGSIAVENPDTGELPCDMFITESEKRTFAVKPMNCPGHIQCSIRASRVIAIYRFGWRNSDPVIAMRLLARCTG